MPNDVWNRSLEKRLTRAADNGRLTEIKLPPAVQELIQKMQLLEVPPVRSKWGTLPGPAQAYLEARYREKVMAKWKALGGANSPLGLPLPNAFPKGTSTLTSFRGGTISLQELGSDATDQVTRHAQLLFVGIQCLQTQESTDEMKAVVAYLRPSMSDFKAIEIQRHDFDGPGVWGTAVALYSGAPCMLTIVGQLTEEDSGSKDYAAALRQGLTEAVKQLPGGQDLEDAIASEDKADTRSFLGKLADDAEEWLIDLVGGGDDPYSTHTLTITGNEIIAPAAMQQVNGVDFNYALDFHDKDDGGDWGTYRLLFKYLVT